MTADKRKATRKGKTKKNLTGKEKAFAKEYVKSNNGTQSVLKVYNTDNPNSASTIANENLLKPKVREEIARLLEEHGMDLSTVLNIHKRNMLQDKHVATSQKAVNDAYELLGLKDQPDTTKVNIAFIIEE